MLFTTSAPPQDAPGSDPMLSLMIAYLTVYFADPFGIGNVADGFFPPKAGTVDHTWKDW